MCLQVQQHFLMLLCSKHHKLPSLKMIKKRNSRRVSVSNPILQPHPISPLSSVKGTTTVRSPPSMHLQKSEGKLPLAPLRCTMQAFFHEGMSQSFSPLYPFLPIANLQSCNEKSQRSSSYGHFRALHLSGVLCNAFAVIGEKVPRSAASERQEELITVTHNHCMFAFIKAGRYRQRKAALRH